jgi:cytochrome c biogenesis protein CcmG, thiol:disulfide interchange protein DsbE
VNPGVGQQTWTGAIGEAWRSAVRHKLAAAFVVLCVAASLAGVALAGTGGPKPAGPAPDPPAPSFSFPVLGHSAQQISLAQYAGRPLIVNFFASWCPPCQQETPLLARFYRTEHGQVTLVGLDENDVLSHALSFTRAKGVAYLVGWDPEAMAASAYGVSALPQTFFLDARHRIVDRVFGAVTLAELNHGIALATGKRAAS